MPFKATVLTRLLKEFKKEITLHAAEIDPTNELDWHSMTVGWAIAKGVPIQDALELATYIRYNTELA